MGKSAAAGSRKKRARSPTIKIVSLLAQQDGRPRAIVTSETKETCREPEEVVLGLRL